MLSVLLHRRRRPLTWRSGVTVVIALGVAGCGSSHVLHPSRPARVEGRHRVDLRAPSVVVARLARLTAGSFDVLPGRAHPPGAFISDAVFRLRARSRGFPLSLRQAEGCTAETAVRSPSGRFLLYTDGAGRVPVLKVLDTRTGRSRVWRADACDPAWAASGAIAYLALRAYSPNGVKPVDGRVVVTQGLDSPDSVWTSAPDQPVAWAGSRLLTIDGEARVRILSAPAAVQNVADLFAGSRSGAHDYGQIASFVALSPTGEFALLSLQEPISGYARDVVVLVRISDARIVSRLLLPNTQTAIAAFGDWSGDHIVAANAVYGGFSSHPPPAVVILSADRLHLRFVSEHGFIYDDKSIPAQQLAGLVQASYVNGNDHAINIWFSDYQDSYQYARCNLATLRCPSGPIRAVRGGFDPSMLLINPSKP